MSPAQQITTLAELKMHTLSLTVNPGSTDDDIKSDIIHWLGYAEDDIAQNACTQTAATVIATLQDETHDGATTYNIHQLETFLQHYHFPYTPSI